MKRSLIGWMRKKSKIRFGIDFNGEIFNLEEIYLHKNQCCNTEDCLPEQTKKVRITIEEI